MNPRKSDLSVKRFSKAVFQRSGPSSKQSFSEAVLQQSGPSAKRSVFYVSFVPNAIHHSHLFSVSLTFEIMKLLGKTKNNRFNYKPRHFDHEGEGSPFAIEHKFDKFRTTVGDNKGLKKKFVMAWQDLKTKSDRATRIRIWVILAILILLFLFFIDFDLSIFYS